MISAAPRDASVKCDCSSLVLLADSMLDRVAKTAEAVRQTIYILHRVIDPEVADPEISQCAKPTTFITS